MYLEYQENADSDKCMTNIKQKIVKHFVDDHEIFTIKKKSDKWKDWMSKMDKKICYVT